MFPCEKHVLSIPWWMCSLKGEIFFFPLRFIVLIMSRKCETVKQSIRICTYHKHFLTCMLWCSHSCKILDLELGKLNLHLSWSMLAPGIHCFFFFLFLNGIFQSLPHVKEFINIFNKLACKMWQSLNNYQLYIHAFLNVFSV